MDPDGDRPSYFVLTYDTASGRVLSLTGHAHDFTGAVLTLTARLHDHRHHPGVAVRLPTGASVPDLLARHAELFESLTFPEA